MVAFLFYLSIIYLSIYLFQLLWTKNIPWFIPTFLHLKYIFVVVVVVVSLLRSALASFSIKGQMVNILGFEGHMVSVTTLQLCQHGAKAAIHTHTHTHTHKHKSMVVFQ